MEESRETVIRIRLSFNSRVCGNTTNVVFKAPQHLQLWSCKACKGSKRSGRNIFVQHV